VQPALLDEVVDEALYLWLRDMRHRGLDVTDAMLKVKARECYQLRHPGEEWEPSNGWLGEWKKRHNVVLGTKYGENKSADKEAAARYQAAFVKEFIGERGV